MDLEFIGAFAILILAFTLISFRKFKGHTIPAYTVALC